jgi:hypothetical protein
LATGEIGKSNFVKNHAAFWQPTCWNLFSKYGDLGNYFFEMWWLWCSFFISPSCTGFCFIAKWQKFSQKENTALHDPVLFSTQVCKLGVGPLHLGVCSINGLEVSVQNPKLRVPISPNFARTEDEIRSQDENSTQQGRKGPNRFSDLDWSSGDSPPSFEFALLTPSLLLIFLIKSSIVRITELCVKSPCLHPVFGPAFTPHPLFQWYPSNIYTFFSFKPYSYLPHF